MSLLKMEKHGSSAWRTKGVLAVLDDERRGFAAAGAVQGQMQRQVRISETQARDNLNDVDAAKNVSTLC